MLAAVEGEEYNLIYKKSYRELKTKFYFETTSSDKEKSSHLFLPVIIIGTKQMSVKMPK